MIVNRGFVFWGVALITAGAVALAVQSGAIDGETARGAWRFWPVVLIAIGVAVIAARTPFALVATLLAALVAGGLAGTLVAGWPDGLGIGCGGEPTEVVSDDGSFGDAAADVELRLNCGEVDVSTAAGPGWSVEARHGPDAQPTIAGDDGSLRVVADDGGFFGFTDSRQEWEVVLPTDVDLDLDLDANAAGARLDLTEGSFTALGVDANAGDVTIDASGAEVDGLSVNANAGSVSITADATTTLAGSVEMNAGSLELCAPEGAVVEVRLDDPNVTFSHDLDERGFSRDGDTWRLGSGTPTVTLEVDGNAANFSYNPDGGCS